MREHHPMRYDRMTEILKSLASTQLSSNFLLKVRLLRLWIRLSLDFRVIFRKIQCRFWSVSTCEMCSLWVMSLLLCWTGGWHLHVVLGCDLDDGGDNHKLGVRRVHTEFVHLQNHHQHSLRFWHHSDGVDCSSCAKLFKNSVRWTTNP